MYSAFCQTDPHFSMYKHMESILEKIRSDVKSQSISQFIEYTKYGNSELYSEKISSFHDFRLYTSRLILFTSINNTQRPL